MASMLEWKGSGFLREVERRSGTKVSACLQCHKCSTGCPTGADMDLLSSQVMRLIHLGAANEVVTSRAIWLCVSCEACTTRCPMEIDVAAVMDTLRMIAVERGVKLSNARGRQFNQAFLNSVRRHGRAFELEALLSYKLRSGTFFADADKAPAMFAKGKLALLPKGIPSVGQVRQVFEDAIQEEKKR
jgi:heterodisulfide reductase subunit C2